MTDEKDKSDGGEWQMPEPVFRSTAGYTPRLGVHDPQDDVPTEPGFAPAVDDDAHTQHVRASTKQRVRHGRKKRGFIKNALSFLGLLGLLAIILLIFFFYWLYTYWPA